jgi:uncharacterized protein
VRAAVTVPLTVVGAGAAGLGWALYENTAFTLRHVTVPVLPPGARELRVLHLSDLHAAPGQQRKRAWVRELGRLDVDLVVDTGDNLASRDGVPVALDMLEPLLDRPGVFVPGSNDWFGPRPKNPARYLLPDTGRRVHGDPLPWGELRSAFVDRGWLDLTHHRHELLLGDGLRVQLAGVSDPHLHADHYDRVAGPVSREADLAIGLTHSPEPRVLDAFAADGFGLLLAGHTHGGQLRVPGYGALVTNCGIDRRRSRGLSRWGGSWLHVSAGLGSSPYTPVRFACPPEATVLRLVARDRQVPDR